MAGKRKLEFELTADDRGLRRGVQSSENALERLNKAGSRAGHGLKIGLGVAAGGAGVLAVGLGKATKAAIESEKSQAKLQAQLKASGISYKEHAKQIDEVIQKTSKLAGLDDEDLQDAFVNVVRSTGDVNKAMKQMTLVADLARAKHLDVAKAGEIVGKVAAGNTGILGRYGITIHKGATATEALGKLHEKFAGQAEAYGKTTAGSLDRANVASENLGETVGSKLTPLLAKGAEALVDVVDAVQDHWPQIKKVAEDVFGFVGRVVNTVKDAITAFVVKNRGDINSFIGAVRNVASAVKTYFQEVIIPTVERILPAIKTVFEGVVDVIRGVIRIISGVLTLDFGKAWDGVKDIFSGAVKVLIGLVRGATAPFRQAGEMIGKALASGFHGAINGLASIGRTVLNALIDVLNVGIKAINAVFDRKIKLPFVGTVFPGLHLDPIGHVQAPVKVPKDQGDHFVTGGNEGGIGDPKGAERVKARAAARAGGLGLADELSRRFKLKFSSGWRSPSHNAAVGGVAGSWHTRGSSGNPGAIDLVGSTGNMNAAAAWVQQNVPGLDEVLVHDAGSGLHLHVAGTGVMGYHGVTAAPAPTATGALRQSPGVAARQRAAADRARARAGHGRDTALARATVPHPAAVAAPPAGDSPIAISAADAGVDPTAQAALDAQTAHNQLLAGLMAEMRAIRRLQERLHDTDMGVIHQFFADIVSRQIGQTLVRSVAIPSYAGGTMKY